MDWKNLTVVHIRWVDPTSQDAWEDIKDFKEEAHVIDTVGFFLKETDSTLSLALNIDVEREGCSCVMSIPKVCIKKRKVLWKTLTK